MKTEKLESPNLMNEKLDSMEQIKVVDPSGMYDKIFKFPEQLEEAAEIGRNLHPDLEYFKDITNIVLTGMGGSAIGGDLARSYLSKRINIPFFICRNYNVPNFVNENTLVIASSYSGNTEESLSAFADAKNRGAKMACFTTGGELRKLAEKNNLFCAKLPTGYAPRAALGFSFVPLLYFLAAIGLAMNVEEDIKEVILGLKRYRDSYSVYTVVEENPAKNLALKLYNKIPIIYTGPELTDAIGTRWKGQICENAKCLAFNNQFPEFNHNELVGWKIIDSYKEKLIVINLRDSDDHERVAQRMSIVKEIIEKLDIETIDVFSQGDFPLGRIFSLIQLGDFVSLYLAILNNIDPTPVEVIDFLKNELAK